MKQTKRRDKLAETEEPTAPSKRNKTSKSRSASKEARKSRPVTRSISKEKRKKAWDGESEEISSPEYSEEER